MQQSKAYIIIYSTILTIFMGGALSLAAVLLKDAQDTAVELETKKQILGAVLSDEDKKKPKSELAKIYDSRIKSIVVNYEGIEIKPEVYGAAKPEAINIKAQYKKPKPEDRFFPVYKYMNAENTAVEAYILPVFGFGLWDDIWGYVAVENDFNTIKGVVFAHKGETPGLGARIADADVQQRFKGKKLYEGTEWLSVAMVKGEGNANLNDHQVDGMSGATITGKGVSRMMKDYLGQYQNFFKQEKAKLGSVSVLN
ncbi:MAG: Na(+)-translocating NADH-quinone reductase subunit C [Flammeovirgaceae bacterium]